jgi:CelD/BcsL family acetyltransferase involved in cellulose biosynthesis
MLADCYGFDCFGLVLTEDDRVRAGLPVVETRRPFSRPRWVSLPFTDYCPPLAADPRALDALASALVQLRHEAGLKSVELRSPLGPAPGIYAQSQAVLHTLPLASDPARVFARFKRTQVQQSIVKAERSGLLARRGQSRADLDRFYALHVDTRRRLGTPVQPRRFFDLLWERVLRADLGHVLLAYKDSVPVAGAVFLTWNRTVTYKYSASDPAHWQLRPNNLLLWTAIRSACEQGYGIFDFGRTDLSTPGLRAFKRGWGTTEEPLVYSAISDRPPSTASGRAARWRERLIQLSPPWACRILGELFYRYAA